MKDKKFKKMKNTMIIFCALAMFATTVSCGQNGTDSSNNIACNISAFTSLIQDDIRPALGNDANFISFTIASEDVQYRVGYAVIVDGVRTNTLLHEYDPIHDSDWGNFRCSILVTDGFFSGDAVLRFGMSFEGGGSTRSPYPLELPIMTGFTYDVRPERFAKTLNIGEEIVLAVFSGSSDNSGVRGIGLYGFDECKTIDEAMNSPDLSNNPINLIFYVSAV